MTADAETDDLDAGEDLPPVPPAPPGTRYFVSDGTLSLMLEVDETGGYVVTCPFDEALITQAETLEEAFFMAHDAAEVLGDVRREDAAAVRASAG